MKPILFALIAVILYGIQNVLIDIKLRQYSTISLLLGFYAILLPLGVGMFVVLKLLGQPIVVPGGESLKVIALVAVAFFVADFFYVGAYTSGGHVVTITIMAVLMPVVATVVKFLYAKEVPSRYHIAGFVCAALAVVFVAIGNKEKPIKLQNADNISHPPSHDKSGG